MEVLIATGNPGKIKEIETLFAGSEIQLRSIGAVPHAKEVLVEENAATFEGNALIKAFRYAYATGMPTLAEDAGLCVDALAGAPGVQSARWVSGSDEDRIKKLLERMSHVGEEDRGARFVACVAFVDPNNGRVRTCEATTAGRILTKPVGESGFGYDPIFLYTDTDKTGGEMTKEEKNAISHRGRAWRTMRTLLEQTA